MAKNEDTKTNDAPAKASTPPRLKTQFENEVAPALAEKFSLSNRMQRPSLDAIVINVNMGRFLDGTKIKPEVKSAVLDTLNVISGQKPIMLRAKKSVANFKVREGYETAAMVTLRRERMWHFLDRFINLATPRIKDFRGLKDSAFDKAGNYSVGLNEQGVFPEVDMTKTNVTHGMNINLVFSGSSPELSRFVLEQLGMPFEKKEDKKKGAA